MGVQPYQASAACLRSCSSVLGCCQPFGADPNSHSWFEYAVGSCQPKSKVTSGTKCRLRSQLLAQLWQQTPPWIATLQCSSGSSKLTHSAANSKLEFLLLNSRSFSPQPRAWLHASCEADPALKYSWLPKPKREEQKQSREGED
jgi:hypothetical protein